MTSPGENDVIEYRWLNMDNRSYTTERGLLDYARTFTGGLTRSVSDGMLMKEPVLMAYGTRQYTYDDVKALDAWLSQRRGEL